MIAYLVKLQVVWAKMNPNQEKLVRFIQHWCGEWKPPGEKHPSSYVHRFYSTKIHILIIFYKCHGPRDLIYVKESELMCKSCKWSDFWCEKGSHFYMRCLLFRQKIKQKFMCFAKSKNNLCFVLQNVTKLRWECHQYWQRTNKHAPILVYTNNTYINKTSQELQKLPYTSDL